MKVYKDYNLYQLAVLQAAAGVKDPTRCHAHETLNGNIVIACNRPYVHLKIVADPNFGIRITAKVFTDNYDVHTYYSKLIVTSKDKIEFGDPGYFEFYECLVTYMTVLLNIFDRVRAIDNPRRIGSSLQLPLWVVNPVGMSPSDLSRYREWTNRISDIDPSLLSEKFN